MLKRKVRLVARFNKRVVRLAPRQGGLSYPLLLAVPTSWLNQLGLQKIIKQVTWPLQPTAALVFKGTALFETTFLPLYGTHIHTDRQSVLLPT